MCGLSVNRRPYVICCCHGLPSNLEKDFFPFPSISLVNCMSGFCSLRRSWKVFISWILWKVLATYLGGEHTRRSYAWSSREGTMHMGGMVIYIDYVDLENFVDLEHFGHFQRPLYDVEEILISIVCINPGRVLVKVHVLWIKWINNNKTMLSILVHMALKIVLVSTSVKSPQLYGWPQGLNQKGKE